MPLTATDLASMTRCEHRVYLDRFGDPAQRVPYPDFVQLLWESGRLHEDDVIDGLDVVQPEGDDLDARFASSIALMANRAPLIYHAVLKSDGLIGEPDLLKHVDGAYVPVEIKSGKALENGKPKRHYIAQLCAYAELLAAVQGTRPAIGYVIDSDGDWVKLDLEEFRPEYERLRDEAKQLDAGVKLTIAGKKTECDQCVWFDVCDRDIRDREDVTLVAGVGPARREKLWQHGIRTISDLANADSSAVGEKWIRQARAQRDGIIEVLAAWTPPQVAFEVSYDVEDFPLDDCVYLHGLLVRGNGVDEYHGICAEDDETEESVWTRFLDRVERIDRLHDYAVYVYSHHEQTKLAILRERYGGSDALERFTSRFVDLYAVIRDHFVLPAESSGLKDVAKLCGFRWRDHDPGGSQSIAWWARYVANPAANQDLRTRVIAYNEDDVRASLAIRDWIAALAPGVSSVRS